MERRVKTAQRVRGVPREVQLAARRLRRAMTPAEQTLWQALRRQHLTGLRFRRQHAVGPFILDFYCPASHLVVEVDGGVHEEPEQAARDAARTEALAAYGYHILRVSNEQVLSDVNAVVRSIVQEASMRAASLPDRGPPRAIDPNGRDLQSMPRAH